MPQMHRTVLVIDGSTDGFENYRLQLGQDSHFFNQILTEPYSESTLGRCQTLALDCILLDLRAIGSHFNFLRQLGSALGKGCPPIVTVGSGDVREAVQALKDGAADYLIRDQIAADDLCLTLRRAIENAELKRQLQNSQEQFQTSVETMMDCFGIFTAMRDQTGKIFDFRIEYLNRAACDSNHMTFEQQAGRGLCEVLPGHRESGLFDAYCQLVETGEPLVKDSVIFEDTYGSAQHLVRAFDIRATKLNDGFVASWRDITDRKQQELSLQLTIDSLQQQQEKLQRHIDQAPVGISIRSPDGEVKVVNDAMLRRALDSLFSFVGMLTPDGTLVDANRTALEAAGLTLQDVINRPFADTYWWAYSAQVQDQLRQAIARAAQGETVRYDVEVRLRADHFITIDFALVPLFDQTGQIEYLVPSGIDVTQRLQVEASLRESQLQMQRQLVELETIYRSAPIGLTLLDQDLRFVRINQLLADINGHPIEAHLGRTVREVLPDLADTAESLLQPILDTGEPLLNVEIEGETPAHPGVKRTWLEQFLPLKRGNQVIGINIVCEEITQRKRHELERQQRAAELKASEARFRLLAETIHDVFWMADFRTAHIQYLSPAYEQIWGRSPEAIYQDYGAWLETVHPDDRSLVMGAFAEQQQADVLELEYRIIRPDGSVRWIRDRGFALQNEAGEIERTVGVAQDITERKQAEADLRQSEERYRTLFETMEDGFCVLEILFDQADNPVDYRFLEVNPAFARHTGLHQAEGKTARAMLPDLEEYWFQLYGQVALTQEPIRFENSSEVMNRWFEVYAFPVGLPEQHKVALLFKEISDRKAIETQREQLLRQEQAAREAAERANRVKDEFLAILSHELRSPLNPILGWSKLLQTRPLPEAKIKQALDTIERNARLLTQLIDDLLDVARILRGKLKLENTPVDLVEVIEAALDTVSSTAATKSIPIQFIPPAISPANSPAAIYVAGDPIRLQQILWNLLSNAIKFTSPQGQVDGNLTLGDGQAQISVTDTGQGISPSFLPHIFESFRQEDISITRKHGGLGLGLSIVRYLVEAHGGTIAAHSPGEGQGATFTVRLPLLQRETPATAIGMTPASTPNLAGLRVMAVDDEADARQILEAILTHHGADVRVMANAAEALAQLSDFRPHVLISDLGMPQTDGYRLIEQVRQLPADQGGQTPAIALTAYAQEDDKQQTLAWGYQRHLAKPFELEDLVKAVANLSQAQSSTLPEADG